LWVVQRQPHRLRAVATDARLDHLHHGTNGASAHAYQHMSPAKAGVEMLMKNLALEWARTAFAPTYHSGLH